MINTKIYTPQFWLLCVSSLLFFASFNMIIPELPEYLTSLGGAQYKGLIISLFTLTAMLSRPFSGKLADKVGRVPVMMFGSTVCFICSLIYPVLSAVSGFLLLRLVHGFSTGFTPTGQTAYLSDIIPPQRRGEAMGLLGTAGSLGMASGPAIGGNIANSFGLHTMFYCSSAFALISIVILVGIKETLHNRHRFHVSILKVKRHDLFEPRVLAPCLVMVLSAYAYGAMFTLIPDLGASVGIKNKGVLFTCLTVASLLVRLVGGKASDRWGRKPVLRVSTSMIAIAMFTIAMADSVILVICGTLIYGFAQGATSPTLLAWATDLSDEHHKGRGVASLYICMEFGIGIGAVVSGTVYGDSPANTFLTFMLCGLFAALAFLYLTLYLPTVKATS
ncbi:MAG TPA: MFS transporter [Ohtaekwangia sp.]